MSTRVHNKSTTHNSIMVGSSTSNNLNRESPAVILSTHVNINSRNNYGGQPQVATGSLNRQTHYNKQHRIATISKNMRNLKTAIEKNQNNSLDLSQINRQTIFGSFG
mmetsp:Transcript_20455/g.19439  ORF Transcript_20455/g.19439 Transcript_20455/m.19439 type:complete len:107 (+) Transcript_20455:182-502(+)